MGKRLTSRWTEPAYTRRSQEDVSYVNSLKLVLVLVPVNAAGAEDREFFLYIYRFLLIFACGARICLKFVEMSWRSLEIS